MASFKCPQCGNVVTADNSQGLVCPSCGYGSAPSWQSQSAPPAPGASFTGQAQAMPPPPGNVPRGAGPMCPRCQSTYTQAGGIPTWAVVASIVGFFVVCVFSLLFLLVKDESVCLNCGLHWR